MQPESRKLLEDMRLAAVSIQHFLRGKSLTDLKGEDLLRSAIYYKFAIIGEALSQLRHQDPQTAERISEQTRIIGFRNQIIHGYKVIEDEVTWNIIERKLPVLLRELEQVLNG